MQAGVVSVCFTAVPLAHSTQTLRKDLGNEWTEGMQSLISETPESRGSWNTRSESSQTYKPYVLKYSEEVWKFPYLHQKASVSWRTWAVGNSNPQLLPQVLENMGSRPGDDEKFCAPYMKPGKSLRNNHIQNKIKTRHVCDHALWFRMFPLFSQNNNNRKAVCPQWILPSIREPLIGNVEFIDVINTVKFSSDYIRRPGNWCPLVSKWSGEQTLKKRKMTTWMSQVNWTIFNRRTDKGSGGEGMEQRPLTWIGVILGFPEKALVFLF